MIQKILIFAGLALAFGCLQTRNEVKEVEQRQVIQQQVSTIQRTSADTVSRFADIEEQLRNLNGKVEVVENQLQKGDQQVMAQTKGVAEQASENSKRTALLQESLIKMEAQISALQAEISGLKAEMAAGSAKSAANSAQKSSKTSFEQAQDLFAQKDWKKAIIGYSKYREDNPKGKNLAEATYKMGVSFQELGMKEDAKVFYDELVAKYPKSEEAKKAKTRLKSLK